MCSESLKQVYLTQNIDCFWDQYLLRKKNQVSVTKVIKKHLSKYLNCLIIERLIVKDMRFLYFEPYYMHYC